MKSMQENRSEETKRIILKSAGALFAKKGYDAVTIREIARKAKCSHTTIYLYFKDKEALLYEFSMPSLHKLRKKMQHVSNGEIKSAEDKLKEMSREYILFCLKNRNMYTVFINEKSSKVDEKPTLEINQLRIEIFEILKRAIQECLIVVNKEQLLAFTRIYYYHLNGILTTYTYQHESNQALMERLTPTFDLTVEILILGFKEKLRLGGEE